MDFFAIMFLPLFTIWIKSLPHCRKKNWHRNNNSLSHYTEVGLKNGTELKLSKNDETVCSFLRSNHLLNTKVPLLNHKMSLSTEKGANRVVQGQLDTKYESTQL